MNVSQKIEIPPNNLPLPLSTFIRREREMGEVKRLIASLIAGLLVFIWADRSHCCCYLDFHSRSHYCRCWRSYCCWRSHFR